MRSRFHRIILFVAVVALHVVGIQPRPVVAQDDMQFFRIATAGRVGTYFPIGGLLSTAISNPPGSRACDQGGACGVPGLVATALTSNGSVANVNAIGFGLVESGFSQSDVAYWAQTGTGVFLGKKPIENLRAIANLYPESLHLVTARNAEIKSVTDLAGKRVSLDEPGSGTLVEARIVLSAYELDERDLDTEYLAPDKAAEKLANGELDAFFFVSGFPAEGIEKLAARFPIRLVPIGGEPAQEVIRQNRFFSEHVIPAGSYEGQEADVETLSVGALWLTSTEQSDDLIYGVTKALWNEASRKLLDEGHAKGRLIAADTALANIAIPLHPGAERYYREAGLLSN
ncbi:TAXI family TRAP transporter solute-binding subunit [Notoacmeibacter sp. MSK16QG-6]|uniref:TAXI family TRAP transporter solute-binding subunit n=1 Tax=Notoacmeibacter sp. MSK16QG-6 TaxID=2957982 RepID=UPI00209D29AD|nr:TAXI family TRAP transporter solute-binding subunit [Notoacmeibacter sp. MSK16QG-6]MCP1198403.1 TAXI family TRAP transporter solute-binding subunit [Notoacmeibacter sp. MSK16QG-6]